VGYTRYRWHGYAKSLAFVTTRGREGAYRVYLASVSDAAAKLSFTLSLAAPFVFLLATGALVVVLLIRAQGQQQARYQRGLEDDIARQTAELDTQNKELKTLLQGLRASEESLRAKQAFIDDTATQIAVGTEEESKLLDEIRHATEQMVTFSGSMLAQVNTIRERASESKRVADRGTGALQSSAQAMEQIASSSREIHAVVELTETMTQHIGILSLNASIEATKAGEYGRSLSGVQVQGRFQLPLPWE
jgi:methyl-accepting chemotaxis protein